MLALESLVGSLGSLNDPLDGDDEMSLPSKLPPFNNSCSAPFDPSDEDLWSGVGGTGGGASSSLLYSHSDLGNSFLNNRQLLQQSSAIVTSLAIVSSCSNKSGTNLGPSPSRQSCTCPLCGRHIAQRRSLKQHLMSNFHRLAPCKADVVIKDYFTNLKIPR